MRILVLSPHAAFWPPQGGTGIRIYNTVRELTRLGHEVDFFAVHVGGGTPVTGLERLCGWHQVMPLAGKSRSVMLVQSLVDPRPFPANRFQDAAAKAALASRLRERSYDVIWVNFLFLLEYLDGVPLGGAAVILDQHEAEELLWEGLRAQGHPLQRVFAAWTLRKFRPYQARWLRTVQALACVSRVEADFMRERLPDGPVPWVVPNGVDLDVFQPAPLAAMPRVLFLGSLNVLRNIDALAWFIAAMWPLIRGRVPTAKLLVVGSAPKPRVARLCEAPGVRLVGPVEDVRPWYAQARVLVAPFRYGVGTRLKVLEAMAMGMPIVSTRMGVIGIDTQDGTDVMLAENAPAFAETVTRVLNDAALAARLREGARRRAETTYGWPVIIRGASQRLERLTGAPVADTVAV